MSNKSKTYGHNYKKISAKGSFLVPLFTVSKNWNRACFYFKDNLKLWRVCKIVYMQLRKGMIRAWDVLQWRSTCLACVRPNWI